MLPVKVMDGVAPFRHTVAVPLMIAVGKGLMVMVAEPLAGFTQPPPVSCTETKLYTNVPATVVGAEIAMELPPDVDTAWLAPPLIL